VLSLAVSKMNSDTTCERHLVLAKEQTTFLGNYYRRPSRNGHGPRIDGQSVNLQPDVLDECALLQSRNRSVLLSKKWIDMNDFLLAFRVRRRR
jgi:hypothetical protein